MAPPSRGSYPSRLNASILTWLAGRPAAGRRWPTLIYGVAYDLAAISTILLLLLASYMYSMYSCSTYM